MIRWDCQASSAAPQQAQTSASREAVSIDVAFIEKYLILSSRAAESLSDDSVSGMVTDANPLWRDLVDGDQAKTRTDSRGLILKIDPLSFAGSDVSF